jgi:hypothetical protein
LTETLHVSRQFLGGYTPSPKKKINSFLNYWYKQSSLLTFY